MYWHIAALNRPANLDNSHTLSLLILITPYEVGITIFCLYTYAHAYIITLHISTQKLPSGFNRKVLNVLPLNVGRRYGFQATTIISPDSAIVSKYNYRRKNKK